MNLYMKIADEKSKQIIIQDLKDILDSCEETGQCLQKYHNGVVVFVKKTTTGYSINAYSEVE